MGGSYILNFVNRTDRVNGRIQAIKIDPQLKPKIRKSS